jgi:hypothetical protein
MRFRTSDTCYGGNYLWNVCIKVFGSYNSSPPRSNNNRYRGRKLRNETQNEVLIVNGDQVEVEKNRSVMMMMMMMMMLVKD